ncbi:MAG: radical SAM protein [Candidatus Thermoplasmatota archaeon]|nr:radical SAM protein [Candidatus Thermoplasmatota archaeon]
MRMISEYGSDDIARVYVAQMREDEGARTDSKRFMVEFVESVQPPIPREQKWVLIVSSMFGCPIRCRMCDAGGEFAGRLTADEILAQIDYMVRLRFPDGRVPTKKFKIQFARMGEPSLNPAVLDAMDRLPRMYDAPGLQASMSTVAPGTKPAREFFEKLIAVKERHYAHGRFQLQFSIHTTDMKMRDELIPTKKWSLEEIAAYGAKFTRPDEGDKKVTLNFAPAVGYPIDAGLLREHFDPSLFMIKLTPLNPTVRGHEESLRSAIDPHDRRTSDRIVEPLKREGFDVVLSIGELEENRIGSNCGQFIQRALNARERPSESYELDRYRAAEKQS